MAPAGNLCLRKFHFQGAAADFRSPEEAAAAAAADSQELLRYRRFNAALAAAHSFF